MKLKFFIVHFTVFLGWVLLSYKLVLFQVIDNERLDQKIESQFASKVEVRARRGEILDKQGRVLATSVLVPSAFIDPKVENLNPYKIRKIARILDIKYSFLKKKLNKNTRFVWLKRKLNESTYEKLKKLGYKGLGFVDEYARVYPYKESLGFLVGKVDVDGKGISGLELEYDGILAGQSIKKKALRDGKGHLVLFSEYEIYDDLKGKDITTSIDIDLQLFLSQSLKHRLKEVDAKRAWAGTMDLRTGEIIAQAQTQARTQAQTQVQKQVRTQVRTQARTQAQTQTQTQAQTQTQTQTQTNSDNKINKINKILEKNIMASEVHEQGSILKTFSFIKAMKKLKMSPSDEVKCHNQGYRIGKRFIRNSHKEDCHKISLVKAFSKSLNTVSAELSLNVGEEALVSYYKKLGFNKKTGIDFPGESNSIFYDKLSGRHQLASLSFGHGLALTSFQVMKAYASLFNNSEGLKPSYVLQETDNFKPVEDKEAFLTKGLLASVVSEEGTAPKAKVNHYLVGGKTGTAQKPDFENGGYSKEVLSTFIGVYPLTKPRYITLVTFDEPQKFRSGGIVSAPVFSEFASFILRKEQIIPDKLNQDNMDDLKGILGKIKKEQDKPYEEGTVPNLQGLSLREALEVANKHKIKMNFIGSGKIYDIQPLPGSELPENRKIALVLSPLNP